MRYLSGYRPSDPVLTAALRAIDVGIMNTPHISYDLTDGVWPWAADNGCFASKWDAAEWKAWLDRQPRTALFAVVPDVVGDHRATRQLWRKYAEFALTRFPSLFVLQDGETGRGVPWDECDGVFVGGTTDFKLSAVAERLVRKAKSKGLLAHMGRVNSYRRLSLAASWGCDTADGTFLAFGPNNNVPRLARWFEKLQETNR